MLSVAAALIIGRLARRGVARVEPPHVAVSGTPVASVDVAPSASAPPSASVVSVRGAPSGRVADGPPAMFRLDPRRTNRSPFRAPRAPIERFRVKLGGPVAAAPIVVDDLLIAASLGGEVVAIDHDGRKKWETRVGARVYGSPMRLGALVVVGIDGGEVLGLAAATGRVKFRQKLEGDVDTGAAPLRDGGFVVSAGHATLALEASGKVRWRHKSKKKRYGAPAVTDGGLVIFGGQDDMLFAVDTAGHERWSVDVGADVDCSPVIADDGTIYIGTDGNEVLAIDADTGRIKRRVAVPGHVRGALSIGRDGALLVATLGPVPTVLALEMTTGRELFRHPVRGTGAKEQGIVGAPLEAADGTLVFGTQGDEVVALDGEGKTLWRFEAGGDVDLPVVLIADGVLAIGTEAGELIVLGEPP